MPGDTILKGVALRLLAVALLSTMAALVKLAESRGAALPEAMFWRQAAALPVVLAFVGAGPGFASLRTARFRGHLARSAVGGVGMIFTLGAVVVLPLAEATTFQFTVPIFATILGATLLGEKTGLQRWSAVLIGFVGVLIVAQPGSAGHVTLWGATVGLLAAFFVSIVSILLRQLRDEPSGTTVFYFTTLTLVPLGIAYAFHLRAHDSFTWAILIAIGLVGGAGQIALTAALRHAPVGVVVPMDYSGLVWATLYGWLMFDALPTPMTWVGAPIIVASGLWIVWREHVRRQIETDRLVD